MLIYFLWDIEIAHFQLEMKRRLTLCANVGVLLAIAVNPVGMDVDRGAETLLFGGFASGTVTRTAAAAAVGVGSGH